MDFLEAVLDPAHEQHRDMVSWYGGPFDPIGFDEARARFCMENMVRRRRGPLASHRSGSRRREMMAVASRMASRIDAAFSAQKRQAASKALRDRQEFEKSAFALMTDFGNTGNLTEISLQ